MTERIYQLSETTLRTLLESARNGDSIPDIMIGLEDNDIEQANERED